MSGIFIDPSILPVGVFGAFQVTFLGFVYGVLLYLASGLIAEGCELLLLVPSCANIVGSLVLPLLGALPDSAMVLFSGIGENAAEEVKVGLGTLAGSTVMLLTLPWACSILLGSVDAEPNGQPIYQPKATSKTSHQTTGTTEAVKQGGRLVFLTSFGYLLVQIPAFFFKPDSKVMVFSITSALVVSICLGGFYFWSCLTETNLGAIAQKENRYALKAVSMLFSHEANMSYILNAFLEGNENILDNSDLKENLLASKAVKRGIRPITDELFNLFDENSDGKITYDEAQYLVNMVSEVKDNNPTEQPTSELRRTLRQAMHASHRPQIKPEHLESDTFNMFDADNSGYLDRDEFMCMICYYSLHLDDSKPSPSTKVMAELGSDQEDDEMDMADSKTAQNKIFKKAMMMLTIGTLIVLTFSEPMCNILNELGSRAGIDPFYLSFVFSPLASNAAEAVASVALSKKKTQKSIQVSLTALTGAAAMNNTICLSVFLGIILARGLAWNYGPEVVTILLVEFFMASYSQRDFYTKRDAIIISAVYPLSLIAVGLMRTLTQN